MVGGGRWEVGGRFKREETYVCLWLIHGDVWKKPTQYCTAIILQLKKKKKTNSKWKKRTLLGRRVSNSDVLGQLSVLEYNIPSTGPKLHSPLNRPSWKQVFSFILPIPVA